MNKICHECILISEDVARFLKEEDEPNGELTKYSKWDDEKVGRNVMKTTGHPPLKLSLYGQG